MWKKNSRSILLLIFIVIICAFFLHFYLVSTGYDSEDDVDLEETYCENNTESAEFRIENYKTIKIAQYPFESPSDSMLKHIFSYTWYTNNTEYSFEIDELSLKELRGKGENPLNIDNYDLLVVGASFDSCVKDGIDPRLIKNIKNFVSCGGGYIGVCAGTAFASQGYENPDRLYKKILNENILKIADVYINNEVFNEVNYIWKLGEYTKNPKQGMIPLNFRINNNTYNPIFDTFEKSKINITYGGGPGLYPANADDSSLREINPILYIEEELMDRYPIHKWRPTLSGWEKGELIKTDVKGQIGGIISSYGDGKIVLFTGHPEIPLTINGGVKEYFGKSSGFGIGVKVPRMVYMYEGEVQNYSSNWWIHRRSAAWVAGVPDEDLPAESVLLCAFNHPKGNMYSNTLYVYKNNEEKTNKFNKIIINILEKPIIKGEISLELFTENCEYVEFYVDGEIQYTDYEYPFSASYEGGLKGVHLLEVKGYAKSGNFASDSLECFFIE